MRAKRTSANAVLCLGLGALCTAAVVGCHVNTAGPGFGYVSGEWAGRTATPIPIATGDDDPTAEPAELIEKLPEELVASDGLTEDEAVAIALWNNAALQQTLGELGVSRARLYAAGLLTDPQFIVFFPVGTKQLEMTVLPAIDAIWLRPIRVRAAKLDLNRVARQMIQNGVDVARDVRLAHADLVQARERAALAKDAVALRREIADLAEKRLDAGDISELEAIATRLDAKQAEADAERFAEDVVIARDRLDALLGYAVDPSDLESISAGDPVLVNRSPDDLVGEALAVRPDLRAAEFAVATARGQREVAKFLFTELDFGWDANADGEEGFESGPALRMRIPVFNANRGNKAVATARLKQALDATRAVHDQIILDVRNAHSRARQAQRNLEALREEIIPKLREAETLARRNFVDGGASYFLVLQTTGQYLDARAQEIQLEGDVRRAIAELDRSVGHRVVDLQESPPAEQHQPDVLPAPPAEDAGASTSTNVEPIAAAMPSGDAGIVTVGGTRPIGVESGANRNTWIWLRGSTDGDAAAGANALASGRSAVVPSEDATTADEQDRREGPPEGPGPRRREGVVYYPLRPDRR